MWVRRRPAKQEGKALGLARVPGSMLAPPGGRWLSPESRSEAGSTARQTHTLAQVTGLLTSPTHPRG